MIVVMRSYSNQCSVEDHPSGCDTTNARIDPLPDRRPDNFEFSCNASGANIKTIPPTRACAESMSSKPCKKCCSRGTQHCVKKTCPKYI